MSAGSSGASNKGSAFQPDAKNHEHPHQEREVSGEKTFVARDCIGCGDETYNPDYCRDCDLERMFARMTCSGCKKLRTTTKAPMSELADALYGDDHRCTCDPRPPDDLAAHPEDYR